MGWCPGWRAFSPRERVKDRVALSQERAHLIRGTVGGMDEVRAAGVDEEADGA